MLLLLFFNRQKWHCVFFGPPAGFPRERRRRPYCPYPYKLHLLSYSLDEIQIQNLGADFRRCNKSNSLHGFSEQGSPMSTNTLVNADRHGSPRAHTSPARRNGLCGASETLFRKISIDVRSFFTEKHGFSGYPGFGGRNTLKKNGLARHAAR